MEPQRAAENDIEKRLTAIEYELKYNVVKRDGPLIHKLTEVSEKVSNLVRDIATKEQIDTALASQTRQLRRTAFNKFSRTEKIMAMLVGIGLLVLNIWEIAIR